MPTPDPSAAQTCDQPMRGLYGATTICARPAGHMGKHDPIWNDKDWPEAPPAATTDEQRTVLEVYSRTHGVLVPDAIQAILASHDALLACLEEAADWLDADLAHAPVTTTSMADRELVQRWRAALERAV